MSVSHPPRLSVKTEASLSEHDGIRVLVLTTRVSPTRCRCDLYFASRLPGPDLAYRLRKVDAGQDGTDREESAYDVNLSDPSCGCSCKGWLRHGHCKHVAALQLLDAKGVLP